MQLNPAEISELIKSRIEGLAPSADIRNQGTVVSVSDGIVRVHGLSDVMQGEMLEFPSAPDGSQTFGLALNLERDSVGAVILGAYEHVSEGDTVKCTGRILEVPVGPELIGRVVNALGQPIDDKGPLNTTDFRAVERVAPGVISRQSVDTPVQTGIKAIDALIPIGRGDGASHGIVRVGGVHDPSRRATGRGNQRPRQRQRQSQTRQGHPKCDPFLVGHSVTPPLCLSVGHDESK